MKRKFLTLFLALAASVGTIFAETGTCGPNAGWVWTDDGVLIIEGSGEMYDYTSSPWATYEITEVYIGNNITKIGKCAFRYLTKLQFVEIGSGVTSIGAAAFEECSGLETIFCKAINPPTCGASTVFDGINLSKVTLFVPKGCVAAYKAADGWKNFTDIQPIGGSQGKKIYATVDDAGTTLTIDYTDDPSEKAVDFWPSELFPNVTTMELKPSMQDARPTKLDSWFDNYTKLTTIKHLEYLNTSEVTDMSYQFQNCWALKELDLSTFDTKNVTNMEIMFYGCEALESLNLTGWNTEKVTNMKSMFGYCEKLKELDLTSFNTEETASWEYMFQECKELTTIYSNSDWTTPNRPIKSERMFEGCVKLVGGNGTAYDATKIDHTYARPDKKGQPGYFTERATGIDNVSASKRNEATKFIRNGELFILRDGKTYNAEGKEVK